MRTFVFLSFLILTCFACGENPQRASPVTNVDLKEVARMQNRNGFMEVLDRHLAAIENRDSAELAATVPSSGAYHLILPDGSSTNTVSAFLDGQYEWFSDTTWTMKMETSFTDIGSDYGIALVNAALTDSDKNGKSYFHKMYVSYGLKKLNGQWKVVKYHCSTKEKSE